MDDDKTDQSHAGPLFDIGHRQIDIEDLIKAKPINTFYRRHEKHPVEGWAIMAQARTPTSTVFSDADREWFDHIASEHGLGYVKCGEDMWSIDPAKD